MALSGPRLERQRNIRMRARGLLSRAELGPSGPLATSSLQFQKPLGSGFGSFSDWRSTPSSPRAGENKPGRKIGPLVADDRRRRGVAGGFRGSTDGGDIFLDVPSANHDAVALARALGLAPALETGRDPFAADRAGICRHHLPVEVAHRIHAVDWARLCGDGVP